MDEWIHATNVESGWNETYSWIIVPTDEWTNGNAPINIFVQFTTPDNDKQSVEFTIANPIILDEQYTGLGSTPAPTTTDPLSSEQAPSNGTLGFGVAVALLYVVLAVIWKQRKIIGEA